MTWRRKLTDKELEELLTRSDSEEEIMESEESDGWLNDDDGDVNVGTPDGETVADIRDFIANRHDSDSEHEMETEANIKMTAPADQFVWTTNAFEPEIHKLDDTNCGWKIEGLRKIEAIEYFEYFFNQELVDLIANETNRYYNFVRHQNVADMSRLKRRKPVDAKEVYCFMAVALLMPHLKKLKINSYWSTDEFVNTPIFSRLMKRDRFLQILRLLHFTDNNLPAAEPREPLHKIKIIIDHLRAKFKQDFCPFENLCIDESLLLFRGRVFFRQYIPSKRHQFGVTFFLLCDCETGYILDFIVYTGARSHIKEFNEANAGKSGNIVLTLLEPYLQRGHTLFVDNWYTSPILFDVLHKNKTNACGIVKSTRKNMPKFPQLGERGTFILQRREACQTCRPLPCWYCNRVCNCNDKSLV